MGQKHDRLVSDSYYIYLVAKQIKTYLQILLAQPISIQHILNALELFLNSIITPLYPIAQYTMIIFIIMIYINIYAPPHHQELTAQ